MYLKTEDRNSCIRRSNNKYSYGPVWINFYSTAPFTVPSVIDTVLPEYTRVPENVAEKLFPSKLVIIKLKEYELFKL